MSAWDLMKIGETYNNWRAAKQRAKQAAFDALPEPPCGNAHKKEHYEWENTEFRCPICAAQADKARAKRERIEEAHKKDQELRTLAKYIAEELRK